MGEGENCRIVVACVGTPLAGDDSIALTLTERLRERGICAVDCPYGIELCAHRIRGIKPLLLIVVDAAVGVDDVTVVSADALASLAVNWIPTTHALPPQAYLRYVESLADKVLFVLIPAKCTALGAKPSTTAMEAAEKAITIVEELVRSFTQD